MAPKSSPPPGKSPPRNGREKRLAEALKRNIARRKAAQKATAPTKPAKP
jgi:hypothetical protein